MERNIKEYRKGPIGALIDEYARATADLKRIILTVNNDDFKKVVDHETKDEDCRSIRSIMNHVVRAGYGYSNYIRKQFSNELEERKENYKFESAKEACDQLDLMLLYSNETLENKMEITEDEISSNKILTSWGQVYDIEQLLEHAIVHILRHRRQIERFITKMK
ncbi:MAG: DinB family protein [Chitinophagales bacterium]|nr:DinB family protein [Chitinophagales bacterium]